MIAYTPQSVRFNGNDEKKEGHKKDAFNGFRLPGYFVTLRKIPFFVRKTIQSRRILLEFSVAIILFVVILINKITSLSLQSGYLMNCELA